MIINLLQNISLRSIVHDAATTISDGLKTICKKIRNFVRRIFKYLFPCLFNNANQGVQRPSNPIPVVRVVNNVDEFKVLPDESYSVVSDDEVEDG